MNAVAPGFEAPVAVPARGGAVPPGCFLNAPGGYNTLMLNVQKRPPRAARPARIVVLLTLTALTGCAGGEAVTTKSIAEARARWEGANVRDYDLEWTSSGQQNARYAVRVRDGRVRSIESIAPGGLRGVVKPAAPEFYGVDGLFTTIADEFAQLDQAAPFGQPRGTKAVLRFHPDPRYGYPRSYRRDVLGAPTALAIDVVRFAPVSVPPPRRRPD